MSGTTVEPLRTNDSAGRGSRARLALAFVAGFLVVFPAAVLVNPVTRRLASESWQKLTWGAVSNGGVRLLLEREGRGLVLVFRNEGPRPLSFFCPGGDEAGVELDVIVHDARGEVVPPRPLDPFAPTPATSPRVLEVPPRTQARLKLDLARYVDLAPGSYRVSVERSRLQLEEPRLRSNELEVLVP